MAKIVAFTNSFFRNYTGSELAVFDAAKYFLKNGYTVYIFCFDKGEPLLSYIPKEIKVINILIQPIPKLEVDILWGQHWAVLTKILSSNKIMAKKILHFSLSPYHIFERVPSYAGLLSGCFGNSWETVQVRRQENPKLDIKVFNNSVLPEFFQSTVKPNSKLLKIAIVGNNRTFGPNGDLEAQLKKHGIGVTFFGFGGELKLLTPSELIKFDAVFTIGRTVQYCMALGIPVFCYDRFGGPGYIKLSNWSECEKMNYSGRTSLCSNNDFDSKLIKNHDTEKIINDLVGNYTSALADLSELQKIARNRYDLFENIEHILKDLTNSKLSVADIESEIQNTEKIIKTNFRVNIPNDKKVMFFYTSITTSYLPKARILVKTLKRANPKAIFILGLSDDLPEGFDVSRELFDHIIFTSELESITDQKNFFFRGNITEVCTAVKPALALTIMKTFNATKVVYLDPDIAVFDSFDDLEKLLDDYSIVLTPHQTIPEKENRWVVGNEILFLKRGIFNLGFFAIRNDEQGKGFLEWWNRRLMSYCIDDDYALLPLLEQHGMLGLFTDQKWVDFVPAYFEKYYIQKHPGYNVSTWNLTQRSCKLQTENQYYINGYKLKFFHFSGFDSRAHHYALDRVIECNPECKDAKNLSAWYEEELMKNGQKELEGKRWKYACYSDGTPIPNEHRKIWLIRKDIQERFVDPFNVSCPDNFYNWANRNQVLHLRSTNQKNRIKKLPLRIVVNVLFPPHTRRRELLKLLRNKFV